MIEQPKKRGRKPKNVPDQPGEETPGNEIQAGEMAAMDVPPPEDPARGEKTPARIRWNSIHRADEMETIYRGWNWRAYLEANPE